MNHLIDSRTASLLSHRRTPEPGVVNLKSCELLHPEVTDLVAGALASFRPAEVVHYPHHQEATAAVARLLDVPTERIIFSAGSDTLIATIVRAFGRSGTRPILQVPCYESWQHFFDLEGQGFDAVSAAPFPGRPLDFAPLLDAMEASPPTVVVVTDPHSPTGVRSDPGHIVALADTARRRGHLLVVDECYAWFDGNDLTGLAVERDEVLLIRSFSKGFGLAGARVAVAVAATPAVEHLARWRIDGPVSAVSLHLVRRLAEQPADLARIWSDIGVWRDQFVDQVLGEREAWVAFDSVANFGTFRTESPAAAADVMSWLLDAGYRVRHLDRVVGLEDCVRITVADPATMRAVVEVIAAMPPEGTT